VSLRPKSATDVGPSRHIQPNAKATMSSVSAASHEEMPIPKVRFGDGPGPRRYERQAMIDLNGSRATRAQAHRR
jgi:hypothetical protein